MSVGIVDGLETVEVDEHDRRGVTVAIAAMNGLLEPVGQEQAVGQSGQCVIVRALFEFVLFGPQTGDVAEQCEVVKAAAGLVKHPVNAQVFDDDAPVLAPVVDFTCPAASLLKGRKHLLKERRRVIAGVEDAGILANDLVPAVARDAGKGRVDVKDADIGIHDHDRFPQVLEHRPGERRACHRSNIRSHDGVCWLVVERR